MRIWLTHRTLTLCEYNRTKNVQTAVEPFFLVCVGLLEIGILQHFGQFYLVVHIKRQCPVVDRLDFRQVTGLKI